MVVAGESSVVLSEVEQKGVEEVLGDGIADVQATEPELRGARAVLAASPSPAAASLQQVLAQLGIQEVVELEVACKARSVELAAAARDEKLKEESLRIWGDRYWEGQDRMMCGRHALNNLFGMPQFDDNSLAVACAEVVAVTGEDEANHKSHDGCYSHGVFAKAIDLTNPPVWRMRTPRAVSTETREGLELVIALVKTFFCHLHTL